MGFGLRSKVPKLSSLSMSEPTSLCLSFLARRTHVIRHPFHDIVGQVYLLTCIYTYKSMDTYMLTDMHTHVKKELLTASGRCLVPRKHWRIITTGSVQVAIFMHTLYSQSIPLPPPCNHALWLLRSFSLTVSSAWNTVLGSLLTIHSYLL